MVSRNLNGCDKFLDRFQNNTLNINVVISRHFMSHDFFEKLLPALKLNSTIEILDLSGNIFMHDDLTLFMSVMDRLELDENEKKYFV